MNLKGNFELTKEKEKIMKELIETNEYKEANSQVLKMQSNLLNALPQMYKPLFLDYEEATAELCDCENKFYFNKGLELRK